MDTTHSFIESNVLPGLLNHCPTVGRSGSKHPGTRFRSIAVVSTFCWARFLQKRRPAIILHESNLPSDVGQSFIGIINSQVQPKLGTGGEHAVRLIGALADQIVDQNPGIAIGAWQL